MVVAASTVSSMRSATSTVPKIPARASRQSDASPNSSRRPLIPSERDNAAITRRPPAKEISSRYLSSYNSSSSSSSIMSTSYSSSTTASLRRLPSPLPNHRPSSPSPFPQNGTLRRSCSVDRTRPTTPRVDSRGGRGGTSPLVSNAARALCTTTRSLSVSFQGEPFFYQTSKVRATSPSPARKPTQERKRATTPTRNPSTGTGEKPSDYHHCWPAARRTHSSLLTKSLDSSLAKDHTVSTAQLLRKSMILDDGTMRTSFDGADLSISSDTDSLSSGSNPGTPELSVHMRATGASGRTDMPVRLRQETISRLRTLPQPETPLTPSNSKNAAPLKSPAVRRSSVDSLAPPLRPSSSPLCGPARPCNPTKRAGSPSRGTASPSRTRVSSGLSCSLPRVQQPSNAPSMINIAAEFRRSKKGDRQVEEAHLLRILYNQHLQWRNVNARTNASLRVQRVSAENKMYNVCLISSELYKFVTIEKIKLQLLTQHLKQETILEGQMVYLDEWFNLESEYSSSLSRAIEALKASTLRLPVVDGARAELQEVKDAVGSAVDVMQAMGASICSLLKKVEGTSSMISELAKVVEQEQALLHHSSDLLSTISTIHVKLCSLRSQFLQLKHTKF